MSPAPSKIFVATPTANGIMLSQHVGAVVQMITRLHAAGIGTQYATVDGPNLILQRDLLAHLFLQSDCTHLLWVDSDMSFEPGLCEKLLSFQKPLVGTIYTRRALDLGRLKSLLPAHGFDHALALAYNWNVRLLGPRLEVTNGLCKVEGIGFGFTLIARACFEQLGQGDDCPVYESPLTGSKVHAFFRETTADNGALLDLDYSFCKRWVDLGGEVLAYVGANIRHVGDFRYGVPFASYLAALQASRPEAPPDAEGISKRPPRTPAASRNGNGAKH
jgi:hypothetical protein